MNFRRAASATGQPTQKIQVNPYVLRIAAIHGRRHDNLRAIYRSCKEVVEIAAHGTGNIKKSAQCDQDWRYYQHSKNLAVRTQHRRTKFVITRYNLSWQDRKSVM